MSIGMLVYLLTPTPEGVLLGTLLAGSSELLWRYERLSQLERIK